MSNRESTRREFLQQATMLGTALALSSGDLLSATEPTHLPPLDLFSYADVTLANDVCQRQLENAHSVLMGLNEDALMQPFRVMSGFPAPEDNLGGWYIYKPDYDYRKDSAGLCPGGTFGQWISALSRHYAIAGDAATRDKVLRLNRLYAQSLGAGFFDKNRFPAYCYDKLVCGLIDSHEFARDPEAFAILQQTTDTVLPYLPPHAVDREQVWRPGKESDISYTWDESYTLPENLFLAYQRGAGDRYKQLAVRFLDDPTYFDPLAAGVNVLPGKHAYSYVNALNSAMQAYFVLGSEKHLRAARNAFEMLVTTQSFATGGWGPDELLREPNTGALAATLVDQHKSFETPCGAYAHFKLTRSLLRVTRDARYGDSMERVFYNTVLGAKPLQSDGTAYYYSDYSYDGHKGYSNHHWPCCSGTLPQVAADYRLNAYLHDAQNIYVNVYLPSTVRWDHGGNLIQLQQVTEYPFANVVRIELTASRAADFGICLRIPAWSTDASVLVNGKLVKTHIRPGQYLPLQQQWKSGDRIELRLPMTMRTEAIDPQHPNIVALMYGPLVLFPVGNRPKPIARQQLLSAKRNGAKEWQLQTAGASIRFLPFTDLSDELYSTYLTVT